MTGIICEYKELLCHPLRTLIARGPAKVVRGNSHKPRRNSNKKPEAKQLPESLRGSLSPFANALNEQWPAL